MGKREQAFINRTCEEVLEQYERETNRDLSELDFSRLDYCSAGVATIGHYEVLKSYSTLVALYDSNTNTLYDVLRLVYGYTATSAKHIAKFRQMHRNANVLTYRDI